MNERTREDQQRIVSGPANDSIRLDLKGVDLRIDPPHGRLADLEARRVEWPTLDHFITPSPGPPEGSVTSVMNSVPSAGQYDLQIFHEASQLASQMNQRFSSLQTGLDQREQALRLSLAELEDEKHRFAHRVAHDQTQLDARKNQLHKEESSFAERRSALEFHEQKLESELAALEQQRSELVRVKQKIREEVLLELHNERTTLARAQSAFQTEYNFVDQLKQSLQQRLDHLSTENERTLKTEREKLWQSLTDEWEQRNSVFQQESTAWAKSRDNEKGEIDREKAMFESAVESANAEFVASREKLALELEGLRNQQLAQQEAEQRDWERTRIAALTALSEAQQASQSELETERARLTTLRNTTVAELLELREQQAAQRQAELQEWERSQREQEAATAAQQAEMQAIREALELELHQRREDFALFLSQEQADWEQQKQAAVAQLEAELQRQSEEQATRLETERTKWEHAQQQAIAEFEAQQHQRSEEHAARLEADRIEWEQARHRSMTDLESRHQQIEAARQAFDLELSERQAAHVAQLQIEQDNWSQQRQLEEIHWQSEQSERFATRAAEIAAQAAEAMAAREALVIEINFVRDQHATALRIEREEWDRTHSVEKSTLQTQQTELLRERTLIENRIRFQQDHLEKSRVELERAQNEHRHERQLDRQRLEEAGLLMIRRLRQIDLYRAAIDEREKSLDREHEVFARTRQAISSTADLDRLNLQAERHAWEQERQVQRDELGRQQETLTSHAENLENRRTRLDKLRIELEETHRTTLEMRLAVEEAWAQLTQAAGQDDARERVEQVRQTLIGYYQQMHETLAEQRREHFESQTKFERQRAEFMEERQKLTLWLKGRDEELRLGEERLRFAEKDAATNQTKWLTARDRWLLEKTEAEQLIRRLMSSLGENNRDQSIDQDSMVRLDQLNA